MKTSTALILLLCTLAACTSRTTSEKTETADSTQHKTVTVVTWNELGVRETPGEQGKYLTTVYLGEELILSGDTASERQGNNVYRYHKVSLSDGKAGWVRDEFIAIDVYPGAILDDVLINKRPDMESVTEQKFYRGDFVVSKTIDGPEWVDVKGKPADGKWFTSGYVKKEHVSFNRLNARYAAILRRSREVTKPELKAVLEKELQDQTIFGASALWTGNQPASAAPSNIAASEVIGIYPLDGNGKDASGHGNDGVLTGTAPATDRHGSSNGAVAFDGKSFIALQLVSQPQLTTPFAVSAWFNTDDMGDKIQTVVSLGRSADGTAFNFGCGRTNGQGRVFFGFIGTNNPIGPEANSNAGGDGQWHHLAGSYDNKSISLYLDGELVGLVGVSPDDDATIKNNFANTSQSIEIGRELETLDRYFNGSIDDVILFNHALTKEAVKKLFTDSR